MTIKANNGDWYTDESLNKNPEVKRVRHSNLDNTTYLRCTIQEMAGGSFLIMQEMGEHSFKIRLSPSAIKEIIY